MKKNDIFNVNLTYFIVAVLFVVVRIITSSGIVDSMGTYGDFAFNIIIQIGILFLIPLALTTLFRKQTIKQTFNDFNFKKISPKEILISIALGIIVFILNIFISTFFSFILYLLGYSNVSSSTVVNPSIGNLILSLFLTAFLPAFCEEFTHRGMLISGYKTLGFKKTVLYSALLFGLLHLNINQFFYASIIGVILAVVTLFSRSIIPAMIIHFLNNGIGVYIEFSAARNLPLGNLYNSFINFLFSGNLIFTFFLILLIVSTLLSLLVLLLRQLLKMNAERSVKEYMGKLAIDEIRKETLGEFYSEEKSKEMTELGNIFSKGMLTRNPVKVEIPYELLGFYMAPNTQATAKDKLFLYGTFLLAGLVTLFTFIWGVI